MRAHRFDRLTRSWTTFVSRRAMVGGLAAAGLLPTTESVLAAKNRARKGKKRTILCRRDGASCKRESNRCKSKFCLTTPFTIEARWSSTGQDHDAVLFVPKAPGDDNPPPSPYIAMDCLASDTNNGALYPFAFFDGDLQAGPGAETGTVRRLLAEKYEFWVRIDGPALAGDLTVRLRHGNGKLVSAWKSPPNPSSADLLGWHVFDINGARRSITVVDEAGIDLLEDEHPETTFVCPD
jgi:hypothetical protein